MKMTTSVSSDVQAGRDLWTGLTLAVLSSLFIGSSFIIKKVSLQRLGSSGRKSAGAGGFAYLTQGLWWTGLLAMGFGEGLNFLAYAFAPAALVTPLGALSVLVTALLAAHCLREPLNVLAKLGCALCLLGSTVVVVHAPHSSSVNTLAHLATNLTDSVFLSYCVFVMVAVAVLLLHYSPRYGARNVLVHLTVCSLIGSFSVLCCKVIGLCFKEGAALQSPLLWAAVPFLLLCVTVQMVYLNKALDLFPTTIVTPIYYVLFTSSVLAASAILFREWHGLSASDAIGMLAGFCTTVIGVAMLQLFRDVDTSRLQLSTLLSQRGGSDPSLSPTGSSRASSLGGGGDLWSAGGQPPDSLPLLHDQEASLHHKAMP